MVATSKIAKQASRAAAAKSGSTVADLATRTTTEAARAPRLPGLRAGAPITGQYLYDRFIGDDAKADLSKMDVVRMMVPLTVDEFKKAVGDFVAVASGKMADAEKVAKEKGWDGKDETLPFEVRDARAKHKTAKNHQTVMRIAYGALKFAADGLAKLGGNEQTGYQLMRELGMKALSGAGLNWDGTKAETDDQRADRRRNDAETKAMLKVQNEHPRKPNENRAEYFARIDSLVEKEIKTIEAEAHQREVQSLAERIRKQAGDNLAEVIDLLLSAKSEPQAPVAPGELH